jgi:hypothetical protein
LIIKLSESHALIDSLKSENTMLFNTIDTLENKLKESKDLLKKLSSDNFKSMICIHKEISNKPDLIIDDLSASTSHASKLDSIGIKHVIVDTACLDNSENSYLIDGEKPKSKESGTQVKFVPTCHNCEKIGHIRLNFYLLKSHRLWNKQVAPKKGNIAKPSFDKYVPPHRRHLSQEGKNFVLYKNANLKIAEPIKKHYSKRSQPTYHHCGVTGYIRPHCHQIQHQKPRIKKQEPKTGKSSSKPSMPHHVFFLEKRIISSRRFSLMLLLWQEWLHQGHILQRDALQAQGNSDL